MTTPKPATEAAEGTRPAGQAEDCGGHVCPEHMSKEPCIYCIAETSDDTAGHPGPAAGVTPVVAVAGREASATVDVAGLIADIRCGLRAGRASPEEYDIAFAALQKLQAHIAALGKP